MSNLQLDYSAQEILADPAIAEPLFAGGVRCHGGYDEDGRYVSPRTRFRRLAIEAWQQHHQETFGTELLNMPLDAWPEHYPNVPQAKYLLREGVRLPLITTLTRVGTVEGFGAMIRHSAVSDIQRFFDEDVRGTAMAHLDGGLLEAHARDEAGYEEEAGHKQMWYATRDIAFERPLSPEQEQEIIERTTLGGPAAAPSNAPPEPEMALLADIDPDLLALAQRMIRILLIEISAFHTFAWAEDVLSDVDLVAGEGDAARIVSYIRQDETPHVEYLRTGLTEMRDRTWIGNSGKKYPGTDVVGRLWDRAVAASLSNTGNYPLTLNELDRALVDNPRRAQIIEGFHALGSVELKPEMLAHPAGPQTY